MTNSMKDGLRLRRRSFLQAAAAGLAAPALASLPGMARAQETVELTMWGWTPNTQKQVDLFMQKYPNIKVKLENVGGGTAQNTKIRTALKAGSGFPDIAQVEFQNLPSFRATDSLLNMGEHGANDYKDQFVDWVWQSVSEGDGVYAMPWDSGPMGLLYRADIFEGAGIANPPSTWAEFAEVAKKFATDNKGKWLTNFGPNNGSWMLGLLWQIGSRPFKNNGTELTIRINDEPAKQWAAYWQDLIDAKAVDLSPAWTPEWFTAFDNGTVASWVAAAWSPVQLTNVAKESAGKWRASYMPQWNAGEKVTSNWGGSTFAALKATQHPKEATLFAAFMATDPEATRLYNTEQFLFPVTKALLNDKELMGAKSDFYGGQAVNEVFAEAAANVAPGFEFPPFFDLYTGALQDNVGAAVGGSGTLADALDKTQEAVVAYAKDQGYTVIT